MSGSQDQDRRLIQPAQAVLGAFGGIAGATLGARLASRFAGRAATRVGQRLGAMFRLQASKVPGATAITGASVRHGSHLLSRFGGLGVKGTAMGAGIGGGSAAGDYLGDYAGRRVTGAQGRNDEYRHVSGLGIILGASAGTAAHGVMHAARRLRGAARWKRSLFATTAGAGGSVAGEASGNVHDQRYGFSESLVGSDRRLTTLGKSWFSAYRPGGSASRQRFPTGDEPLTDRRQGYGSVFQRSGIPGATRLAATGGATSGSTMATGQSGALAAWERKRRAATTPRFSETTQRLWSGQGRILMGGLFTAFGKRAPGAPLSDAEHKQRVEAGKASAEARRGKSEGLRGVAGAGPRLKQPAWYRRTRIAHDDPDFDGRGASQDPTAPGASGYLENERKPQVPKAWGEKRYLDLARWSAETAKGQHERIATDGRNKRMIPEGVDDATVRLALDHTRNLAMHDVGLWNYRFRMTPEAREKLQPLWRSGFLWHARRSQANALRQGKPGEYADLRREFGTPFRDGRTYRHATRGQQVGEEKKRFYRHLQLVKRGG